MENSSKVITLIKKLVTNRNDIVRDYVMLKDKVPNRKVDLSNDEREIILMYKLLICSYIAEFMIVLVFWAISFYIFNKIVLKYIFLT